MADAAANHRDIESLLAAQAGRTRLRLIACGSVDDGKSTLIGRLLYESAGIFEDQLATLTADSVTMGTRGGGLDLALLTDGLAAEREQGITIDVAYRYFSTATRNYILADAPGHEQYTRNMVTGASTADVAVVLVDARKGVLTQTRRHTYLVSLLGIRRAVLAVNKMDLVDYARGAFDQIEGEYQEFCARIGLPDVTCIPISAVTGDNVVSRSAAMPWYGGPALLGLLDAIPVPDDPAAKPLRLPVQRIARPHQDFRGITGVIASGVLRAGDMVSVLPSHRQSRVTQVLVGDREVESASAGRSVTVTLADDIDVARGDVLSAPDHEPGVADQLQATMVWMHEHALMPGRSYLMKLATQTAIATVTRLKYAIDVNTHAHVASRRLEMNELGVCDLDLGRPVVFDPYVENRDLGGFILIDRLTNETVGAGLVQFALRRSQNLRWQAFEVSGSSRARLMGQRPCVVWLTGLSGAGKSTIANIVEKRLHQLGQHTYILDGDNVRHGLSRDLGFTEADRVENIRRVAEVARLMADAGLIVLVSFISPYRADRTMARELLPDGQFIEVFVDAPLSVVEARDPKGLYGKARRGELKNFTGIDAPYEAPEDPNLHIDTSTVSAEQAADRIVDALRSAGVISAH